MSGADPRDAVDFDPRHHTALRGAVADLSWLLGRGYAEVAAVALVGNHHQLTERQRHAVRRCAAPPEVAAARRALRRATLDGQAVVIDGFNVLVTVERGLAGGAVFRGVDGALRDVAGVHGTWRRSDGTATALAAVNAALGSSPAVWVLDAPVSNSGRLAALIRASGAEVEVVDHADARVRALGAEGRVVCSSDAWILDTGAPWFGLAEAALGPDRALSLG